MTADTVREVFWWVVCAGFIVFMLGAIIADVIKYLRDKS